MIIKLMTLFLYFLIGGIFAVILAQTDYIEEFNNIEILLIILVYPSFIPILLFLVVKTMIHKYKNSKFRKKILTRRKVKLSK